MVQIAQPQLEQAQIAAVSPMDLSQRLGVRPCLDTQVDDPDVGQTGCQQQPLEPLGGREMTLLQIEPATFLIREEGFDPKTAPIPAARFPHAGHVADQVERLIIAAAPPGNEQYRGRRRRE